MELPCDAITRKAVDAFKKIGRRAEMQRELTGKPILEVLNMEFGALCAIVAIAEKKNAGLDTAEEESKFARDGKILLRISLLIWGRVLKVGVEKILPIALSAEIIMDRILQKIAIGQLLSNKC